MPSKNFLKMNTAIGAGTCGSKSAQYVLIRCTVWNSRNSGTISACGGIMMPARIAA